MHARVLKSMSRVIALAFVGLIPVALAGQSPAASTAKSAPGDSPSRWDIFAGYSYLAPKGSVATTLPDGSTATENYDSVNVGGLFSAAYFFNRHIGLQGEFGEHEWGDQSSLPVGTPGSNIGTHGNDDGFMSVAGGLIARFPKANVTPFLHALVGTDQVNGPFSQPNKWGRCADGRRRSGL